MNNYEHNKLWRRRHPEIWNAGKRRNYRLSEDGAFNTKKDWTTKDDEAVLRHDVTDRELAATIGRSARAIQVRRSRLTHG